MMAPSSSPPILLVCLAAATGAILGSLLTPGVVVTTPLTHVPPVGSSGSVGLYPTYLNPQTPSVRALATSEARRLPADPLRRRCAGTRQLPPADPLPPASRRSPTCRRPTTSPTCGATSRCWMGAASTAASCSAATPRGCAHLRRSSPRVRRPLRGPAARCIMHGVALSWRGHEQPG